MAERSDLRPQPALLTYSPRSETASKLRLARTRWERLHPIRAGRLWRCRALGTHHPVIVDMGQRKVCMTCNEWDENGR